MITKVSLSLPLLLVAIQICNGKVSTSCDNGPNIQFTATPSFVVPGLTPRITLRCSFAYSPYCQLGHDRIMVYKNKYHLAATSGSPPSTDILNWSREDNIHVTGSVKDLPFSDKNHFTAGRIGFLNITWTNPKMTVADTYHCHFFGNRYSIDDNVIIYSSIDKPATWTKSIVIDRMVFAKEISEIAQNASILDQKISTLDQKTSTLNKKTATLNQKTATLDTKTATLNQKTSTLSKASEEHKQKLDSAFTEIAKNNKLNQAESMAVGKEIGKLSKAERDQRVRLDDELHNREKLEGWVTSCVTPRSAFMVSTDKHVLPTRSRTQDNFFPSHIVYEKTVFDKDNSFDNKTGTFTCKQPGMWHFTVNVVSRIWFGFQIRVNDKAISTSSTSPQMDGSDRGAALSALVHMKAGDVARVHYLYSTRALYGNRHYVNGNAFTGELVQSDKCLVE